MHKCVEKRLLVLISEFIVVNILKYLDNLPAFRIFLLTCNKVLHLIVIGAYFPFVYGIFCRKSTIVSIKRQFLCILNTSASVSFFI